MVIQKGDDSAGRISSNASGQITNTIKASLPGVGHQGYATKASYQGCDITRSIKDRLSGSCYRDGAIMAILSRLRAIDYATAIKAGPAALCYEATLPRQRLCEARPTKATASA